MTQIDQQHLAYYEEELLFLRQMGGAFAKKYPKVANRIRLSGDVSPDPHTERLLESFAFLTSYLKREVSEQFPQFAQTFLEVLYPQLVAPIPPMSIAQFCLDPSKGKTTTGYKIPRKTPLFTEAKNKDVCRFNTSYDLTLWPITVKEIKVQQSSVYSFSQALTPYPFILEVVLETESLDLAKYEIDELCFYINADTVMANTLYEYLFLTEHKVAFYNPDTLQYTIAPTGSLAQVGFGEDENVLPDFPQSLPAYRLLQEFFAFPDKFMFFKVKNVSFNGMTKTARILLPLASYDDTLSRKLLLTPDFLKLGGTPIINLFSQITDPVNFDNKKIEYPLIPDVRRVLTTEIHSIEKVVSTIPNTDQVQTISPYFSYHHQDIMDKQAKYWFAKRQLQIEGIPGTRTFISFTDLNFSPTSPPAEVVYAYTLCTNRELAQFVRSGSTLQADVSLPTHNIICLHQPTPTIYNFLDGADQWKLVSQLSVNYLSLSSGAESLKAFQEILSLYSANVQEVMPTGVGNIINMEVTPIVRRIGQDAWRGMAKGSGVTLTLDDKQFARCDALLFSAVLSHFLNIYTMINSFVELSVLRADNPQIWKTWPAQIGTKPLL